MLKAYPNILSENVEETVIYKMDLLNYLVIEPQMYKSENIYFMESSMELEDNIWDFLEISEKEVRFFEIYD